MSAVPGGHRKLLHAPACPRGTYLPGLQTVQGVAALKSLSVLPAAHSNALQFPKAPEVVYEPAEHMTQGVTGLESTSAVPGGHEAHTKGVENSK